MSVTAPMPQDDVVSLWQERKSAFLQAAGTRSGQRHAYRGHRRRRARESVRLTLKRALDVTAAGAALLFFAPLFLAIAGYHLLARRELDPTTVRVIIDTGLLTIALGSVAIRKPFTMQFAREVVEPRLHGEPRFIRTNYVLSLVWSGAFILMLLADVASIYLPGTPLWVCAAIAFAARNSATYFTQWYRKHVRAEIAANATTATV